MHPIKVGMDELPSGTTADISHFNYAVLIIWNLRIDNFKNVLMSVKIAAHVKQNAPNKV